MPSKGTCSTAKPGDRFGRLVVISASGKSRRCMCDCGEIVVVQRTSALTSGNTTSCGCYRREASRSAWKTHGATVGRKATRGYAVWQTMLQRCYNSSNHKWPRYGGRGIVVCDRWHEFENFIADMGEPPARRMIERRNNDGNYEPTNCVWATDTEQARNRSNNRILTFRGRSLTVAQWTEETGLKRNTIASRLRLGWSIAKALTEKPRGL